MKKILYLICFSVLLFSCSNESVNEATSVSNTISDKDIATRYFENRIFLELNNKNVRNVGSIDYPSIMYDLTIYDDNGDLINFEQLSESEKEIFYSNWKRENIEQLQKKLAKNPDLRVTLEIDNEIMSDLLNTVERTVTFTAPEKLLKKYLNKLDVYRYSDDLEEDNIRAADKYTLTEECLNMNSVLFLKENYKQGYILATTDNGSSSSAFVGHASLLSEQGWDNSWEEDGLSKIAYTAWPKLEGQMKWPGKKDGVQQEPIAVWAGNKKVCVGMVKILKHRRAVHDKNGNTTYKDASDDDFYKAVKYAESKDGVKYSVISHLSMNDEERFYCSKLVQKSFLIVSNEFKFSNFFWTTPGDLISAKNTVIIAEFDNQNNK